MSNWQYADKLPTSPWRGQMTIPRQLALRTFPEGIRLMQEPLPALRRLRGKPAKEPSGGSFEVETTLKIDPGADAGWKLTAKDGSTVAIGYDAGREELYVDRTHSLFPARTSAPLRLTNRQLAMDIFVDRSSVEVFADEGRVAITDLIFQQPPVSMTFYASGNATRLSDAIWPLKSIWAGK
jgi:fructan beta-fructosidase